MNYITLARIGIFFITLCIVTPCAAQYKIKLSDVTKFEFIMLGGGLSDVSYHVEVIRESKAWKSYQTKRTGVDIKNAKQINDTSRTFITEVPTNILAKLLVRFAKPDTSINLNSFNINKSEIVSYLDSLPGHYFTPAQKAELAKAAHSDKLLYQIVYKKFHPAFEMDDKNYYDIKITTNNQQIFNTEAYSFGSPYLLPWMIGAVKSYDPGITVIFDQIIGHPAFAEIEHKRLQQDIALSLYNNKL